MTDFLILDVFSDVPFAGNQLAVIPDALGVPEDQMQRIAREFNFSETTFVLPPDDPAHTARVRIFTPMTEVPFAGHPFIGTAVALASLGRGPEMVFELGVGPLPCRAEGGKASFSTDVPLTRSHSPEAKVIAECLGLEATDVRTDRVAPIMAGLGLEFAFAELASQDALDRAAPVTDRFRAAAERYPGPLDFAIMAYVRNGTSVDARMFAPLDNIPEDPATGSAAAALTALLADADGADLSLRITQGVMMGRPSLIETQAKLGGGVTVSGHAVQTATGRLTLP
ncbi:MAG: PhzF family phenazine biosynthesis protein [Pseudomonadota bacterium]